MYEEYKKKFKVKINNIDNSVWYFALENKLWIIFLKISFWTGYNFNGFQPQWYLVQPYLSLKQQPLFQWNFIKDNNIEIKHKCGYMLQICLCDRKSYLFN